MAPSSRGIASKPTFRGVMDPSETFGTFDVSGQYSYVANSDSTISQFTVADGGLVPLNPATISTGPVEPYFPVASSP